MPDGEVVKPIEQIRRIAFDQQEIGMGFNSDTGKVVGTALLFDEPTKEPGQEALASATIINTHESLMDALDMSFEAEGRYAFSSGSLKAKFSRSTTYNSVSTFVVARMVVQNQITRGRSFRVTPDAKHLLDTNQGEVFARAFGDSFVRGRLTGGEFYAVMRLASVDTSTQSSLAVMLQAEINTGLAGGGFTGALNKAMQSSKTRSEFNVTFYQRGGSGGEEIGTTITIDEIMARLKDLPSAVARHPFPYQVELATYDTIPLPTPPKAQQEAFLLALADANKRKLEFLQKQNDFEFAAEHPEYFEDPPAPQVCAAAAQSFLQAANAAISHSVRLSRGEIDPPVLLDLAALDPPITLPVLKLRKKSLDHRAFRDWYLLRDDPAITQDDHMLVNAIVEVAKTEINDFDAIASEAQKGEALEAVVDGFEEIDLAQIDVFENEQIVRLGSIEHLGGMLPSGITRLNLNRNHLDSLRGVERFSRLTELTVDGNERIEQITELGALPELRELRIAGNRVSDLAPLIACTHLERVVLSNNRIVDLAPLVALPKLSSLVVESMRIGTGDPTVADTFNPIQHAIGLEQNPALANPFLLGSTLDVRFGRLSEGPDAQFTGRAERIGETLRFKVELARGNEVLVDEWALSQINSSPNTIFGGPEGSQLLVLFVMSLGHSVLGFSLAGDRPNAMIDRDPGNGDLSIDATLLD